MVAKVVPAGNRATLAELSVRPAVTIYERLPDGSEQLLTGGSTLTPARGADTSGPTPTIPWYGCLPFAALLGGIALFPFINEKWWHAHYPDVSMFLGGLVVGYYLGELGGYGRSTVAHTAVEYYSFFALVGGLFVASGGILVDVRARGTPAVNTAILAAGAVLANIVGTTGASMLLIRPFMRINSAEHGGQLRPLHVVFFILIVSNCGGCLTPVGDPPLYLGYLKGVPFSWTLTNLWPMWLLVNGLLLAVFFVSDSVLARRQPLSPLPADDAAKPGMRIVGAGGIICLLLIVACVFVDPLLKRYAGIEHVPVGATLQVLLAAAAYFMAPRHVHQANHFNFAPAKEVGLLFAGIFATMMPALAFLDENAPMLGLTTPTQFYFATGSLSAGLDNAPTYLSFLQIAAGVLGLHLTPEDIHRLLHGTFVIVDGASGRRVDFTGRVMLEAISLGAVFFGALTYIGNGPNFMVKAIAEARGVKMPGFFGYVLMAAAVLGPVLVLNWFVFIR